jgi:hypothetical protein
VGNRPVPSEGQWRAPGSYLTAPLRVLSFASRARGSDRRLLPYGIGPDLASRPPAAARSNLSRAPDAARGYLSRSPRGRDASAPGAAAPYRRDLGAAPTRLIEADGDCLLPVGYLFVTATASKRAALPFLHRPFDRLLRGFTITWHGAFPFPGVGRGAARGPLRTERDRSNRAIFETSRGSALRRSGFGADCANICQYL